MQAISIRTGSVTEGRYKKYTYIFNIFIVQLFITIMLVWVVLDIIVYSLRIS